jgi:hypothetical protein
VNKPNGSFVKPTQVGYITWHTENASA